MSTRIVQAPDPQGPDEKIQYKLRVSPSPVEVLGVVVFEEPGYTDVTDEVMPGLYDEFDALTTEVSGDIITLPLLQELTLHRDYRVEVLYFDGTNTLEPTFLVRCRKLAV